MNKNPFSNTDKEAYRIAYLIAGYIRNTLNIAEHKELDDWVNESDRNMKLFEDLTDERNMEANLAMMERVQSERIFNELQQGGKFEKPNGRKIVIAWVSTAAVTILVLALFLLWRAGDSSSVSNAVSETATKDVLQPGGNKATLTLPDGSVIDVAHAKNGILSDSLSLNIVKKDDSALIYETGLDKREQNDAIHTLNIPAGGQFRVTLSDNTQVWLNAESTLRYPVAFGEGERKVELQGEAYFEVAHDTKSPFKVLLADSNTVTVLGTRFNIQSYPEEKDKAITLAEGKVVVESDHNKTVLFPGMQAVIEGNAVNVIKKADIEEITGWKDGVFVFHDASIEKIMSQAARWYNAEIVYRGNIKQQFNATISRSEPLEKLLHLLELNGYVKFKTENNIIYVLP